MIKTDISGILSFLPYTALEAMEQRLSAAHKRLESGGEFTGWLRLPGKQNKDELSRIEAAAQKIRGDSDVLVVIGIGGSYLGARAVNDLLSPIYTAKRPEIIYAGNGLSGSRVSRICEYLRDKDFSVNVISKSGTTTEPAVAFRVFEKLLREKYGAEADGRVYATTDAYKGALLTLAKEKQYERFVIPSDVGGRYSVLTPVGLLPIAAAGININALLAGACEAETVLSHRGMDNPAWLYAAARQALYNGGRGKKIEILGFWEPELRFLGEWWKQLFGESEGKEGLGLFPSSLELTADLHSMGQYVQEGERSLFETFLWASPGAGASSVEIPYLEPDLDGLNYLSGKSLDYVNQIAMKATKEAHISGGVPCIELDMGEINAENIGALLYFFEISCALSGYVSGVNPFDQPGVEAYKKNMFRLLGKPGY
jgi:glucose-6-phosphate isomerase